MTFLWTECTKGRAPPRACVCAGRWVFVRRGVIWKVTAGWVCLLFSVQLQPIKRQDWQIYSSSFSSSPTPSCVLLSFPPPPPLCLLFILSSLPLPFYHTLLGLTLVLEMTFQWCELFNNIKPAAATKSKTQRTFFSPHFLSQVKMHSLHLRVQIQKGSFSGHKVMHILQWEFHETLSIFFSFLLHQCFLWPPTAFMMYQGGCTGKDTSCIKYAMFCYSQTGIHLCRIYMNAFRKEEIL